MTVRPWRRALAWAAVCSLVFMVAYGGCTYVTAHRSDVDTLYFDWELRLPFVPLMIVPYWSIDLLFVGSFFLCSGREELDLLGRRILLAIVLAAVCFLLFPLRIAFPRPDVPGFQGALFRLLRGFDGPYNLVPSLHIALRTLLADVYARHTRGSLRVLVHAWFSLIGISTVLTYQHHVIDVAGGFVLALLCFYLLRGARVRAPVTPNPRIGGYYVTACVLTSALAAAAWPWGSLLAWPAVALAIVASGYFGVGPSVYRKEKDRLALSARILLAPCLFGQWLSLVHYRRRCRPWDEIVPGLWIGRQLSDREATDALRAGVTSVLDVAAEFSEATPFRAATRLSLPILDLTAPTSDQLHEAVGFLSEQRDRARSGGGATYVHCKIGYSRSAAVAGAYLLHAREASTVDEALSLMRRARPSLVVRPEAVEALRGFHAVERQR